MTQEFMKFPKITLKSFYYLPVLFLSFLAFNLNAQQLAFPTAKGAGAYATGGRGGQVIHVTTLDWDAPGGLKEAIQTPGPRIIVFDVSGEIDATSEWNYTPIISGSDYDNITIAGQSAPAGGISIKTSEFMFREVSNVIIRYIRFRNAENSIQDSLWFTGGNNIIFDHCTFSHGGDESGSLASGYGRPQDPTVIMGNITVQNCFFQDSKTGSILGTETQDGDFTFVNNVFSNISHRFPNPKGNGHYDIINNIVYNWKYRLIRITGSGTYNVVNNYYKGSANGIRQPGWFNNVDITASFLQKLQTQPDNNPLIYAAGSLIEEQREIPLGDDSDMWSVFAGSHLPENSQVPEQYFTSSQFSLAGHNFTIKPASEVYNTLLNDVGADKTLNANGSIYPYRDDKDASDILMIQNDTYEGSFYDSKTSIPYPTVPQNTRPSSFDTNNDGMPDVWKIARGFAADEDLSNHVWPSGYIGVEEYLNEIDLNGIEVIEATGVEVTPEIATVNMPNTINLTATIFPQEATNQNGTWSSSDETIAIVNSNGVVTPVSEGVVTITFTSMDGGFTDSTELTVTNIVISLESLLITPENSILELGESVQLITEFFPSNTSDVTGIWSSSDESIAIVNDNGLVSAVSEGEVEILFTANDGGITNGSVITVVDEFYGTYVLYNAETDLIIQNIESDVAINLEDEGDRINFRCIPQGGDDSTEVESVGITWTGPTNGSWIESDAIYAGLPNGHVGLNFEPYLVEEGTYNFTVTYYSGNGGSGSVVAIDDFSINFFFDLLPVADAGLDQVICSGETVTLTASGGPIFLWSTGETTASIEVNPTTTEIYTVTVSDDEGNTDEDSVTVTVNDLPVANAGEDQIICEGESTILTASGGTSYLWSTGETTASIEVNPELETTYNVEVISNNCSSTDEVTVFVNEAPTIIVTEDIVIVEGESTTLTANGGDNYEWNTGETTESITVTPDVTTTYSVSSLGANGCIATVNVTVTVVPEVIANAGDDTTICSGETITLSASGGSTYLWDNGEEVSDLVVSPETTTTYTVTVEDDFGFTDTDTVTVFVNEIPSITANEDVFVMFGNAVTLTASGGVSYLWSTGETTAEITVSPEVNTTYSVTGFSENGCQNTIEILVTVVDVLSANAGEDVSICLGESITLNASGGVTYTWNTGNTGSSPTFTPLETTTYTVTVEDGFGNSDSDEVTITVNPVPIANAGDDQVICNGESVVLTAEGGDSYLWSTGDTTASITVNPNEDTIYSVEVTTNNCSSTDDVMVTVLPTPEIIISEDTVIITGNSTTLEVSGGDSYLWNTGETTDTLVVNPTETTTYTVTASMENGCESTSEVTVTVIPEVVAEAGDDVAICSGESIVLNASGGVTYLWDTGDTSSTITVSPTETITYTVTVTDDYGNSDSDSVTVTVNELPNLTVSENVIINEGDSTNLIADGADTYLWSTEESSSSINVSPLETTTYSVTGFSSNGCSTTLQVTVTVIPEVIANAGNDIEICQGEYVILSATGGSNFLWSTGQNSASITFSPTETTTLTVTVSDDYGNSDTDSVTVIVNDLPSLTLIEDITILEGQSANLVVSGAESYLWETGETTASITVSPTESTTYSVTGFSENGCQVIKEVLVVVLSVVIADAGPDVVICSGDSVTLTASGSSYFSWNTGETSASIVVSPTETTTYTVIVSDDYGNIDSDSVTVVVPDLSDVTIGENITIIEGESTTLTASGAHVYLWSTGQNSNSISVSPNVTTTYTATGFSSNGCESEEVQVTVTVVPEVVANAGSNVAICIGESVTLNATGGGGSNFSWNTGQTGASITFSPTETATYTVTVSDNFGNSDTDSVTVTVHELPNLVVSENITIFEGESTNLVADGAETYLWSTGDSSSSILVSPLETTTYSVTGFSINGCETTAQVVVTVIPAEVIANAGNDVSICIGESVTLNASGSSNYSWNTGDTVANPTFTPTETTTYTVTVSDDLGNSDTDSVTVTVNELPSITVSENITIFEGESVNLIADGAETYLWNTGDSSSSIVVSPLETTTYMVTGFSANGCETTAQVEVTVIPEIIANAGNDVSICIGESVTLNASGGTSYIWNTGGSGANPTFTPTETTTYTVTVSDDYGNSDTDSVTVIVNEIPVITASENITIVEGESTTLSVNGAETYLWSTGDTSNSIVVSPTQTTTYTVIGATNTCSSDVVEVVVTVIPVFLASAGEDAYVCDNQTYEVTLTANEGDSYLWSTGETTQSIVVSPLSTTSYTVTVFNNGQEDTDDVMVHVDPSPEVVIANGDSVEILNGDFVTLSASGANTYEWSNGATQPNIAVSPSTTTTYEVKGYIGDCYDEKLVTVNVFDYVNADAGEDVVICLNEMTTLTATGGDEYVWSTGETTPTIQVSPDVTTDYTVTVFNPLDFDEATVRVEIDTDCIAQTTDPTDIPKDFKFNLYPNPADDQVNIKFSGVLVVSDLHIYDVTGKLIQRTQISNENISTSSTIQVDISSLQSGVYFVKFIGEETDVTKKLIVE